MKQVWKQRIPFPLRNSTCFIYLFYFGCAGSLLWHAGFATCATKPGCLEACGILGPWPGVKLASPALEGRFLKPSMCFFIHAYHLNPWKSAEMGRVGLFLLQTSKLKLREVKRFDGGMIRSRIVELVRSALPILLLAYASLLFNSSPAVLDSL